MLEDEIDYDITGRSADYDKCIQVFGEYGTYYALGGAAIDIHGDGRGKAAGGVGLSAGARGSVSFGAAGAGGGHLYGDGKAGYKGYGGIGYGGGIGGGRLGGGGGVAGGYFQIHDDIKSETEADGSVGCCSGLCRCLAFAECQLCFFLLLALLLVALLFVLIFLFAGAAGVGTTYVSSSLTSSGTVSCLSDDCMTQSGALVATMQLSVKPCEDFYSYSCGNYRGSSEQTVSAAAHTSSWSGSSEVLNYQGAESRAYSRMYSQLTSSYAGNQSYLLKAQNFYKSCMNVEQREAGGVSSMDSFIRSSLGQGYFFNTANVNANPPSDYFSKLLAPLLEAGVSPFIKISTAINPYSPNKYAIVIRPGDLMVPHSILRANSSFHKTNFEDYYMNLLSWLGSTKAQRAHATRVWELMQWISQAYRSAISGRTRTYQIYKQLTISQLSSNSYAGPNLGIKNVLDLYYETTTNTHFSNNYPLLVAYEDYFKSLRQILSLTGGSDRTVRANFMLFSLIHSYSGFINSRFAYRKQNFAQSITGVRVVQKAAWRRCTSMTASVFPRVVNYAYSTSGWTLTERTNMINQAKAIANRVRNSFVYMLENGSPLRWIKSDSARKTAIEKIKKVTFIFPGKSATPTNLNSYYSAFTVSSSDVFANYRNFRKFGVRRQKNLQAKATVSSTDYIQTTLSPDIVHYQTLLEIHISLTALSPPYFDIRRQRSQNFAGFGNIIAQKLIRFVDSRGAYYNANGVGTASSWYLKEDEDEYTKVGTCFRNQGSLSGNSGEALIGESVGLRISNFAYQREMRSLNKREGRHPTTRLSSQQLFYVSYAQSYCNSASSTSAAGRGIRRRLRATLANSKDFVYWNNCRVNGSAYYFESTCAVF